MMHSAEQTSLNYLLYNTGLHTFLDATFNHNLHIGTGCRDPLAGKVVTDQAFPREIAIVHLTQSSAQMQRYLDGGLLYDRGAYLSEAEKQALLQLSHY